MVTEFHWNWFMFSLWVKYCGVTYLTIHLKNDNDFSVHPAQPVARPPSPAYDPYAGMKTPGQRQLISLQERVKVGEITVDEAVQEFKAWQFDHERRANSIRYQNVHQLFKLYSLSARWLEFIEHITCAVFMFCFFLPGKHQAITRQHHQTSQGETEDRKRAWYNHSIINIWRLILYFWSQMDVLLLLMPDLALCPGRLWNKCPPAEELIL